MPFELIITEHVATEIETLQRRDQRKHRRVMKCLALLEQDPAYPSLATHRFDIITGPYGEALWESYVENKSPSAWRVWWFYGPDDGVITVVDLGPHP